MNLDRAHADGQPAGNVFIIELEMHQPCDLQLSGRQHRFQLIFDFPASVQTLRKIQPVNCQPVLPCVYGPNAVLEPTSQL